MFKHVIRRTFLIAAWPIIVTAGTHDPSWQSLQNSRSPFQTPPTQQQKNTITRVLNVHHTTAQIAAKQLKAWLKAFNKHCNVQPLSNQNQLWCIGTATCCQQITQPLHLLDQAKPQIRIRAKIISIDKERARALGIAFKTIVRDQDGLSTVLPKLSTLDGTAVISLAHLGDNNLFAMELSALERNGQAKIIAQPTLTTENNKAAIIETGEEVPYQQNTSSGATNVTFKKAVLRLRVTPQAQDKNHIQCAIDIHQDKVTPINVNGAPIIHTQHIQTHATILNRHTLVLGGIITNSSESSLQAVPGLSQIPVMGKLFKHQQLKSKQQELFIFITPELIR